MHEVSNVFSPTLARVDSNGDHVDINTLSPPTTFGSRKGLINTAAATMDGNDNYYFTAVTIDTESYSKNTTLVPGHHKKRFEIEGRRPDQYHISKNIIGLLY